MGVFRQPQSLTFKWSLFPVYTSGRPQQLIELLYKIYTFLIIQIIYLFFCLLLIYSLVLCFWRYKVLLYPYTTQFLNYTISLHMNLFLFFIIHCIYVIYCIYAFNHSSTRPLFLCKKILIYAGFFFCFFF